jgi:hypothetical protein
MPVDRLRIEDFSDREFLLILVDVADADGWSDSEHVRERMDLAERRIASSRLSWLRRYGAVEREHARDETGNLRYHRNGKLMFTQRWRLTKLGEAWAYGRLRKREETALAGMGEEQLPLVTRWLAERTRGETGAAKLVQREWRYGHAHRNGSG